MTEIKIDDKITTPQLRYDVTCTLCFRRYISPIPIPSKDSSAVIFCPICDCVLCRFDWGGIVYDESTIKVEHN